jgi:hypothetical protein
MERATIKTALDICDQYNLGDEGYVTTVLMDCGNELATKDKKIDLLECELAEIVEIGFQSKKDVTVLRQQVALLREALEVFAKLHFEEAIAALAATEEK